MGEIPAEVRRPQLPEQQDPALVQGIEQSERQLHRGGPCVRQLGPACLLVWSYRGLVLSQRELDASVCVEMAVRNMVDHLANGPPAGAVGSVELRCRKSANRGAQVSGCGGDLSDALLSCLRVGITIVLKTPDRVA